jgi:hypothetical protein
MSDRGEAMAETEQREHATETDDEQREHTPEPENEGGEEAPRSEGQATEEEQEQGSPESGDEDDQRAAAKKHEEERDQAREEIGKLEEADPEELPDDLEEWPGGKAKYETFGGPEGEEGYDDSATAKLGPSSLRHHEGGDVSIEGEKVDDPDEYKGDPIPGGPTDPNTEDKKL